jgi:hypothetical protein
MAVEDSGQAYRDFMAIAEASLGRPRKGSEEIRIIGVGGSRQAVPDPDIDSLPLPEPDALVYRPFPIDALPSVLRDYVAELADALCADHGAIATVMHGALAAAVGTTRQAEAKGSWQTYGILWVGLVADSGDLKSPIMRHVLLPVKAFQDELMREYGEAKRLYDQELAEHERQLEHRPPRGHAHNEGGNEGGDEGRNEGRNEGSNDADAVDLAARSAEGAAHGRGWRRRGGDCRHHWRGPSRRSAGPGPNRGR